MLKRQELTDPKSCMSRAADDEMTFVLLGRDAAAAATVRFWAERRVELGKNLPTDAQIVEALHSADVMERTARCARCRTLFVATTAGHARDEYAICGNCFDDLKADADAERGAAEHEATGPHEATTDEF